MPPSIFIKLCGLRTEADVDAALACGADRIGFVLTRSPRRVDEATCRRLRARVPEGVPVHGLFTDETAEEMRRLAGTCGLDVLQIHGREEDAALWERLDAWDLRAMRVFRVRGRETLPRLAAARGKLFVLDAYVPGVPGGTGERFDWSLAAAAREYGPVLLAGGLTPGNVGDAIRTARPAGVDVSGGIERAPGEKDPERMRAFIEAARAAARETKDPPHAPNAS